MDAATREAICAAAVRAAKAVDYVGAGTIEFIADASEGLRADRVFFMEMNTRLQVEHPVTEEITGVDLVEWQLRVASGEPLPRKQEELSINGHAIEARLYAEDPAKGFLPSTGRLEQFFASPVFARVETGVESGATISPYYDPMVAKLICHAKDREGAIKAMRKSTGHVQIWPIKHNAWFLYRLLDLPDFVAGAMTTGSIAEHLDDLTAPPALPKLVLALEAQDLLYADVFGNDYARLSGIGGFRLNAPPKRSVRLLVDGREVEVDPEFGSDEGVFDLTIQGQNGKLFFCNGATFLVEPYRFETTGHHSAHDGDIVAPMPGKVIAVDVAEGQHVEAGQRLIVLEAMKMEHALTAPFAGTVANLVAREGSQVQVEALLARVVKANP
jgi:3-methylcrotonyl-CoA carboxylase alpha subunit